jgi:phosphocarrier protein
MIEVRETLRIGNRLGLHARAAALFVQTVQPFDCEITVTKDGETVDGRSIMGLMMLAAGKGSSIELVVSGPDAERVVESIRSLVSDKFNEGE